MFPMVGLSDYLAPETSSWTSPSQLLSENECVGFSSAVRERLRARRAPLGVRRAQHVSFRDGLALRSHLFSFTVPTLTCCQLSVVTSREQDGTSMVFACQYDSLSARGARRRSKDIQLARSRDQYRSRLRVRLSPLQSAIYALLKILTKLKYACINTQTCETKLVPNCWELQEDWGWLGNVDGRAAGRAR